MFFKRKNYDFAEQISELEQSVEHWSKRYYNLEERFNFEKRNYRILKQEYEECSVELDNTKKELDKYTMLYHDALCHLRQIIEATNYGKE